MKVSELYSHVTGLGFSDGIDGSEVFYQALNRAVLQISSIRPKISSYVINHRPLDNMLGDMFETSTKFEELCYYAQDAKSFCFECDGIGTVYLEKYNSSTDDYVIFKFIELSSYGEFKSYRGFVKDGDVFVTGKIRLRFAGPYLFSVRNPAFYKYIFSEREEDIPAFSPYSRYDISTLVPDFLSFLDPPIKDDGEFLRLSSDYDVEGGKIILLPHNARGTFKILYRHLPEKIVNEGAPASDDTVIDLDDELASLLPNLIAAYVWVDDEPTLAEYYLTLYRERSADVKDSIVNSVPVYMKNQSGW